jgi:hypothetical protein
MWRNNDRALTDDAYCNLIENTISASLPEHSNPVISWTWTQCRIRKAARKYAKEAADQKRKERDMLEKLYLEQLSIADPDSADTAIRLQRFYHDEDAAIRFRAKTDQTKSDEKNYTLLLFSHKTK